MSNFAEGMAVWLKMLASFVLKLSVRYWRITLSTIAAAVVWRYLARLL